MPIDLYSSTLKPFIIPLGFTVTATICLLMTLKKCMRGYVLCRQLSCQNFSFYFVLNLDTGQELLLEGKLNEYLHDIDEGCHEMLDRIVEKMKE